MYRLICLCLCALTISCADVVKVQHTSRSALPVLKVAGDSSGKSLRISRLQVDVQVTGNIATTVFDITFYNDLDRVLEGEFDFPLADGQSISRYALEVDDKLREGVVVEKVKARVAFENTVRKNIDPGLVEKTLGNHFRTRVYPIPARGHKRILIGIEQTLRLSAEGLRYELPLSTGYPLEQFSVATVVARPSAKPLLVATSWKGFGFREGDVGWKALFDQAKFQPSEAVSFTIPIDPKTPLVYTGTRGGDTYFYAFLPTDSARQARPLPKSITLYWDRSSSAGQRNLEKETALLGAYMSALEDVTVTVVPFAIQAFPASTFRIRNGNAGDLIRFLKKNTDYDGGTQLGALDLKRFPAEEIWLLSDGISTFGRKEITLSATPVTVVTSAPGADFSYLRYIVRQTGGRFVDLSATDAAPAAGQLLSEYRHFIRADFDAAAVEALVTPVPTGMRDGFAVAGRLKRGEATITLHFRYGNTSSTQTIVVRKGAGATAGVARIWANMTINELDLRYELNKEAITRLGKQFSIVTRNTSLLVLDRVEDYVEHEIEPPSELRKEYMALLEERNRDRKDRKAQAFEEALVTMRDLVDWWQSPVRKTVAQTIAVDSALVVGTANGSFATADSTAAGNASMQRQAPAESYGWSTTAAAEAPAEARVSNLEIADVKVSKPASSDPGPPAIELKEWKADAPYLSELEATAPAGRYARYLSLKERYAQQPSFFIDVARFFHAKKEEALALQVLSNVGELKLEDPELLRVVAEQLLEFGQTELAVLTFRDILELREEEPQAYRDLALACNEAGDHGEAVRLLYRVATGEWDARFSGIRQVALTEMNAIISAHGGQVDVSGIDRQFIHAMPVDVRIVIGWSSNDSDVDLWVTDPHAEKCFYSNTSTALGGRISHDATQGYGPEEFLLKKAVNGAYTIDANLYGDRRQTLGGPITIRAELFTDFGRPGQQRKVILFRLKDDKEVVNIGKLVFGKAG